MKENANGEDASGLEDLERKAKTMGTCTEVAALITSTLDFNEVMSLIMEKTKEVMNAEACSILLYNKNTDKLEFSLALHDDVEKAEKLQDKVEIEMGQGIAGWVAQSLKPVLVEDAQKDPRFMKSIDKLTSFTTRSLMAVPMVGRSGLLGVVEILNPKHRKHFEQFDLEVFLALSRQMAVALENARYHEESLKIERLRNELEIAASIQRSFLPDPPFIEKGKFRVSGVNVSAATVGGDFFDFIDYPDGALGVVVGDVAGKGVSGAIYMSKIMSDFRYIALTSRTTGEAFGRLNSQIAGAPRGMFLTAVYIIVEPITGRLQISVAGHPPALWLTREGLKILDAPAGPPLGIIRTEYPASTISMEEGDRLVVVTDGAFEARDSKGNMMGFKGLVEFLKKRCDESEILNALMKHLKEFTSGGRTQDDVTAVEIAYGEKS